MAKQIVVSLGGTNSTFDFKKVTRAGLMGRNSRRVLDPDGEVCTRASVTRDGSLLLRSGMSAQGYFTRSGGRWIPNKELIGVDPAGRPVEKVPSTLGEPQELNGPVDVEDFLDLSVASLYALDPVELDASLKKSLEKGEIYRFLFNTREDYEGQTAYLIAAKDDLPYCVIGNQTGADWIAPKSVPEETFDDEDPFQDEGEDDLMDF
jgi:hypothetical protein